MDTASCELCGRSGSDLTRHHLLPRARHANKRNKRSFSREEVRGRVARLCLPCHKQVHALLSEKELERSFDSVAKLTAHPEIRRFVTWIRSKPAGTQVAARRSRSRGDPGRGPR